MDSSEGSRSLLGASDELFDVTCGPCQTGETVKQATHYCKECREYLCTTCKDYHRKLAVTKNHNILSGTDMPAPSSTKCQDIAFIAYCGCNKNQQVEFYCEDHQDIICNPCRKIKHLKCQTSEIKEKSARYPLQRLDSVLSKIKSLKHRFESMQKVRKCDNTTLKSLTEKCKKEIKEFRAKIDSFLDKLEQNVMQELAEFDKVQTQHVDKHISSLTTGLQTLDSDYQLLESAKKNANKAKMFITEFQITKSLQEYETVLCEIETDASKPTLSFVGNKRLAELQAEVCSLGSLKRADKSLGFADKSKYEYEKEVLLGMKATSQNKVNIQASPSDDDVEINWITSCTFMPNGYAVLCDHLNDKLILLDRALVLTDSLKLSSSPWDVSVVDDNNVIITLPNTAELQYIQVFPQLREGRVMQEFKTCRGIDVVGHEIYTQFDDSEQGEAQVLTLKVLDLKGNLKRKLQTGFTVNYPHHIAVSKAGEKIFCF